MFVRGRSVQVRVSSRSFKNVYTLSAMCISERRLLHIHAHLLGNTFSRVFNLYFSTLTVDTLSLRSYSYGPWGRTTLHVECELVDQIVPLFELKLIVYKFSEAGFSTMFVMRKYMDANEIQDV